VEVFPTKERHRLCQQNHRGTVEIHLMNPDPSLFWQSSSCTALCAAVGWMREQLTACILLKQLSSRCSKNIKMKKIIKLTVNTGQVMFSGKIYYY